MTQYYGEESVFNEKVTFTKDVVIYGNLEYDFAYETDNLTVDNITVNDTANIDNLNVNNNLYFSGIATFTNNVILSGNTSATNLNVDDLIVGIATVRKRFELTNVNGTNYFVGFSEGSYAGRVGIGSALPEQKLDIAGAVKINTNIFDSSNSEGANGYYLSRDGTGIRWVPIIPSITQGIFIQDEGQYIPIAGIAASFNTLNFTQINSLGIGTDTLIPIPNPSNPTVIANIQTKDLWGFNGSNDIYRMTNVGIQNNNPTSTLDINGTLHSTGAVEFDSTLDVDGATTLNNTLDVDGASTLNSTLDVDGNVTFNSTTQSTDKDTGSVVVEGGVGIEKNLNVGENTKLTGTLELDSSLIDVNGSTSTGKFDYRLSSVGTGVSWRPPGVQTQNAIWVTMDGDDSNSGFLEGDAKRTVGAAASIAQEGDTIFVRSGVYYENNPIGLRTDVSVSGQDLRLVTIVPNNVTEDVFHVRRGCLIENLNFAGSNVSIAHTGCGAVAFPPSDPAKSAVSGYTAPGPATEGSSGRWRSPYIRNCTNFMTNSIGMKIDGNNATAATIGANLKSMVCDSFTQYNENGIGVSITNNGYAQLVSIFTINCDIGIYCDTGGSCDLTNSNSSFGNYGLVAVGLGSTEFTGKVNANTIADVDTVVCKNVVDSSNTVRRPYDGQALWFKINLDNYPDAVGTGIITAPFEELDSITILDGGSGYSQNFPPTVTIRDSDGTVAPKGPQGIIAEASPNIDANGQITSIDVIRSGRNYLSTQNIVVDIDGNTGLATAVMKPIYFTVASSTLPTNLGITSITFNEFVPYEIFEDDDIEIRRISRILTSSHSFEYIGTGTNINTSTPLQGAIPIKANEVVARDGAQIPFTSTDQKGNFDIGEGIQVDQTTSTIRGRSFSRAIQAEITPLIIALR